MADGTVQYKFAADTASAEANLVKLERKLDSLENKIKQGARTSRRSNTDQLTGMQRLQAGIGSVTGSVASMAAGYLAIPALIGGIISANKEMIEQAGVAAEKYDTLFRKFRVQASLGVLQADAAQKSILNVAGKNAFTAEQGAEAATQLVSSGFSSDQAQGPALDILLQALSASNQVGKEVDAKSLAAGAAGYLNSQGQALSGENLEKTLIPVQRLFKGTNLQIADLTEFSKQAAVFDGKLTGEEQFASLAALRDVNLPAAEATTALRNFVTAVSAQKLDKKKIPLFEQLGIDPNEIDLQGENLGQVLDTLADRFEKVDPELLDSLLKKFFDKANIANVKKLVENREKIQANIALQKDVAGFNEDRDIGQSGIAAGRGRIKLKTEAVMATMDQDYDLFLEALNLEQAEQIQAGELSPFRAKVRQLGFKAASWFDSPQDAAWWVDTEAPQRLRGRIDEATGPKGLPADELKKAMMEANAPVVEAIKQQTDEVKKSQPKQINRDANTER